VSAMSAEGKKAMLTLLVKTGTVSRRDIARAERLSFLCIVECSDPESSRFLEPPSLISNLDDQARAAQSRRPSAGGAVAVPDGSRGEHRRFEAQ
jgi:hypothetical protein